MIILGCEMGVPPFKETPISWHSDSPGVKRSTCSLRLRQAFELHPKRWQRVTPPATRHRAAGVLEVENSAFTRKIWRGPTFRREMELGNHICRFFQGFKVEPVWGLYVYIFPVKITSTTLFFWWGKGSKWKAFMTWALFNISMLSASRQTCSFRYS